MKTLTTKNQIEEILSKYSNIKFSLITKIGHAGGGDGMGTEHMCLDIYGGKKYPEYEAMKEEIKALGYNVHLVLHKWCNGNICEPNEVKLYVGMSKRDLENLDSPFDCEVKVALYDIGYSSNYNKLTHSLVGVYVAI
jgi:hypothetical protein